MQQRKIATRKLRAGETLLKAGDKLHYLYVVQSGRVSLCQKKGERTVEITQLRAPETIGDEAVFGPASWQMTALAIRDSVVVEIPVEMVQAQVNEGSPHLKAILKGLSDRAKMTFSDLKALQVNREIVPCPADNTAKIFGVIFHTARSVGRKQGHSTVVDWDEFKKFAFEVFDESVIRLEDACNILVKLGYAKLEGDALHLMEMPQIEAFFDYFGNYHFKSGYGEFLKTNAKLQKVTEEFLKISAEYQADRAGNVQLPYKSTIDAMKVALGNTFEADQLFRLEQKGLFIKRQTTNDGGVLSFYRPDFEQMLLNWKILRELELWNENGFVEGVGLGGAPAAPEDPEGERKRWSRLLAAWKPFVSAKGEVKLRTGAKKAGETWCETCMSVVKRGQKACDVCGAAIS